MNYRHSFHAGNFADVHKHASLLAILDYLTRKAAPLLFLDTHAGRGLYDLHSAEAARAGEWRDGVGRLMAAAPGVADHAQGEILLRYLEIVRRFNLRTGLSGRNEGADARADGKRTDVEDALQDDLPDTATEGLNRLRHYPGSPLFALAALRANDRFVFVEKMPGEASTLRAEVGRRRGVSVLTEDGYAALKAQLPPKENRGVVLIDPPYEAADEFEQVVQALVAAVKRWPTGIFCVWYPITARQNPQRFHNAVVVAGVRNVLVSELYVRPADSPLGLNGSGFLVVNPPWQTDETFEALMPQLQEALAPEENGGHWRVEWLAGGEPR